MRLGKLSVIVCFYASAFACVAGNAQNTAIPGVFQLTPVASSLQCLDAAGPSLLNGAAAQIYDCGSFAGSPNQSWQLKPLVVSGTTFYQLVNVYSGLCLDVNGESSHNGAHLQQWSCGGTASTNQLWTFRSVGAAYELISVNSSKCLDLPGGNSAHGTLLQQWACGNDRDSNQLWFLRSNTSTSQPTAAEVIPVSYFGLSLINPAANIPPLRFGAMRSWDFSPSVSWATLNPAPGVYNFSNLDQLIANAQLQGADILYTFGETPDWASSAVSATSADGSHQCAPPANMMDLDLFVQALVVHAKGKIKLWEAWNEPQYYYCGSFSELMTMVQHISRSIRTLDPSSKLLSIAGTNGNGHSTLASFLSAGGAAYVDIIAYHGYGPGADESVQTTEQSYKSVMQQYSVASLPLWDTESSWYFSNSQSNLQSQAAYLAKSYLLHWSSGVQRFYWYAFDDAVWGTLWNSSAGLQPDATAYAQVFRWMVGASMTQPCSEDANRTWSCVLTRPGGYTGTAIWNSSQSLLVAAPAHAIQYHDLTGRLSALTTGQSVHISNLPILIETASAF